MAPHIYSATYIKPEYPLIMGHLRDAIINYWDHLYQSSNTLITSDMCAFKLHYHYGIELKRIDSCEQPIHWIVANEDSEEAAMFKLEWG